MHTHLLTILLIFQVMASPALAGPWLKKKGAGFAELSFSATGAQDYGTSAYFEYGATADTTIGVDIGLYENALNERNGYGTIFLRRAFGPDDTASKWAYELGVGIIRADNLNTPTLKTGLTWGRGLDWRGRSGWVTVDGAIIWDLTRNEQLTKLDSTIGLNLSETMAAMLQINFAHTDEETLGRVEPSLVIRPDTDKFRIKIGADAPLDDVSETALTLGLWYDF